MRDEQKVPAGEREEVCRGVDAITNVFIQAATYGVTLKGTTLYCLSPISPHSAKMIINAGVERVVCLHALQNGIAKDMFEETNIKYLKKNTNFINTLFIL